MKVILLDDVKKLGNEGDVMEVADGFARNFLLPRKLALPATEGNLRRVKTEEAARKHRRERVVGQARQLAERLVNAAFVIKAKSGEEGKLFGAVTGADIAKTIETKLGVHLDKRQIGLSEPIKRVGSHKVLVKLDSEVSATIKVDVEGD